MKYNKILITGANGFLGSQMADIFSGAGFVNTYLQYRNLEKQKPKHIKTSPQYGDLNDLSFVRETLKAVQPDVILHCAGCVPSKTRTHTQKEYLYSNQRPLMVLSDAVALDHKHKAPHIISFSSAAVYQDQVLLRDINGTDITFKKEKDALPQPLLKSDYAYSKMAGEKTLQEEYQGNWTILRCAGVVGKGEVRGTVVDEICYSILTNTEINLDFNCVRDYVSIEDVAKGAMNCISSPNSNKDIFNIGSGQGTTGREAIIAVKELIEEMTDQLYPLDVIKQEDVLPNRHVVLDVSKANKFLRYNPEVAGKEVFRPAVEHILSQAEPVNYLQKILGKVPS